MSPDAMVYIYALLDPDGTPRYVGHSKNPAQRARDHRSHRHNKYLAAKYNPPFSAWLDSLPGCPAYRIIAAVARADRFKWEKFYTDRLRQAGAELLNIASGIIILRSEQWRANQSASKKAYWSRVREEVAV